MFKKKFYRCLSRGLPDYSLIIINHRDSISLLFILSADRNLKLLLVLYYFYVFAFSSVSELINVITKNSDYCIYYTITF